MHFCYKSPKSIVSKSFLKKVLIRTEQSIQWQGEIGVRLFGVASLQLF